MIKIISIKVSLFVVKRETLSVLEGENICVLHSVWVLISKRRLSSWLDNINTALMVKSKAICKERQPGGGDFSLQSKRRLSQRSVRVSSRSCSPEQSLSPTHSKHHSPVTHVEFVNISNESRVLSSHRGQVMASLNPSASSSPCSADLAYDQQRKRRGKAISQHDISPSAPSQHRPPLSCSSDRLPFPSSTPRPGYGAVPSLGVVTGISPTLVHFLDVSVAAACPIQAVDVQDPVGKWKHCLVGYVVGKFPGFSAMLSYINRTWQHEVHFSIHDSGWLLFDFSSETAMLDILGSGPYAIFGRPLVLKIMPEFFDFQFTEITSMPTWVRFPNLPLRC